MKSHMYTCLMVGRVRGCGGAGGVGESTGSRVCLRGCMPKLYLQRRWEMTYTGKYISLFHNLRIRRARDRAHSGVVQWDVAYVRAYRSMLSG